MSWMVVNLFNLLQCYKKNQFEQRLYVLKLLLGLKFKPVVAIFKIYLGYINGKTFTLLEIENY